MGLRESKLCFLAYEEATKRGMFRAMIERPVCQVKVSFVVYYSRFSFCLLETCSVTDDEMQRLRLAFKRCSGVSGFMLQPVFAREVLGDGVPSKVAEVRNTLSVMQFL